MENTLPPAELKALAEAQARGDAAYAAQLVPDGMDQAGSVHGAFGRHDGCGAGAPQGLRGEILNAIELGTFDYAKYFPGSPQLKKFGLSSAGKDATAQTAVRNLRTHAISDHAKVIPAELAVSPPPAVGAHTHTRLEGCRASVVDYRLGNQGALNPPNPHPAARRNRARHHRRDH